jgi:hypothetical protein
MDHSATPAQLEAVENFIEELQRLGVKSFEGFGFKVELDLSRGTLPTAGVDAPEPVKGGFAEMVAQGQREALTSSYHAPTLWGGKGPPSFPGVKKSATAESK